MKSANNIDEQVKSATNLFKEVVELTDYESKMIDNAIRYSRSVVASTKLQLTESIDILLRIKSDLSYLRLKLNDKRRSVRVPYRNEYDKQFTMLTKMNRPSRQSIESEMHYMSESMRSARDTVDKFDNLVEYINTLSEIIDRKISNMESRRYDL